MSDSDTQMESEVRDILKELAPILVAVLGKLNQLLAQTKETNRILGIAGKNSIPPTGINAIAVNLEGVV